MNPFKQLYGRLLSVYNSEEQMFRIGIGLKFLMVSLACTFSVILFTYILIRIDLIFFVANGFPGALDFKDAFMEYIYTAFIYEEFAWLLCSGIFIFCLGYYLSGVMIRPFKAIGSYCEGKLTDKNNSYTPDFFSNLKLLTSFSVLFFTIIDDKMIKKSKLERMEIPHHFTRIHKPNFEKNFFFNYLFIIIIFALLSSMGMVFLNLAIRDQVFDLARQFLSQSEHVNYFLSEQFIIADIAVYFFVLLHLFLYFLLGVHLYSKIAVPAFAVFATMRSFLKGNYHSRVHLIGYYYLRNDCRKINKYLDHIQKNLT